MCDSYDSAKHQVMADYGIVCKIQNLEKIVKNLDSFMKKNKIRSQGMVKNLGMVNGIFGSPDEKFCEWSIYVGASLKFPLSPEQGYSWHFDMHPNRHYHIHPDGTTSEVYAYPERKDLPFYCTLIKHHIYSCNEEDTMLREDFYSKLFNSIGFPIVQLHNYSVGENRV